VHQRDITRRTEGVESISVPSESKRIPEIERSGIVSCRLRGGEEGEGGGERERGRKAVLENSARAADLGSSGHDDDDDWKHA